jgi:hypothetical protein
MGLCSAALSCVSSRRSYNAARSPNERTIKHLRPLVVVGGTSCCMPPQRNLVYLPSPRRPELEKLIYLLIHVSGAIPFGRRAVSSRVYSPAPAHRTTYKKGDFERKFSAKSVFIDLSTERVLDKLLFFFSIHTRLHPAQFLLLTAGK